MSYYAEVWLEISYAEGDPGYKCAQWQNFPVLLPNSESMEDAQRNKNKSQQYHYNNIVHVTTFNMCRMSCKWTELCQFKDNKNNMLVNPYRSTNKTA